jgi:hypothetical protein
MRSITEEVTFDDISEEEFSVVKRDGRPMGADLYPLMCHIASLPHHSAVKITRFPAHMAERLRPAVRRRWPHLQVRQIGEVIIVEPRVTWASSCGC